VNLPTLNTRALLHAGDPSGSEMPLIGLTPAWLTHIGEPPTKRAGPWSKLPALKSSITTPLPPAPMKGLAWTSLSKNALIVAMFW
jgi:hypothetical protein